MNERDIEGLFHAARALPVSERSAYLDRACAEEPSARAEVEALLAADAEASILARQVRGEDQDETSAFPNAGRFAPSGAVGEQPGQEIGRYKLLQPIGEGGFGVVWLAEQREPVKRRVALKIIKLGMDTKQVVARFEAERQALAMMDHPNIAKVLDAGATDLGRPYFVMEYIRGIPIVEYCDNETLGTGARLELFTKVCQAIQHAHQKGVIHRDIKPSNVLVTLHDGVPVPKVIDFGIAKAIDQELTSRTLFTEHHQIVGTPAYMSPEQAEMRGIDIDTRSDIYALGVLLYELLTGSTPFDTQTLASKGFGEMMRIIREETPAKPSTRLSAMGRDASRAAVLRRSDVRRLGLVLRGDLDWIVMKCLEKDRRRRYETANELAADIGRHVRHEPVVAGPPSATYRVQKFVRRNRKSVVAGSAIVFALILGTIGTSFGMVWAIRERDRADASAEQARLAEARANERADQIQRIAAFQADQLSVIDVSGMGRSLHDNVLGAARTADETRHASDQTIEANQQELETLLAGADFTGVALSALRANIFAPALEAINAKFTDQPELRSDLLQSLADTATRLGALDFALGPQQAAVDLRTEALGRSAPKTLGARIQLGILFRELGRLGDAEKIYDDVLSESTAANGPDNLITIRASNNLAVLYTAQARNEEAEALLRVCLEFEERTLGPDAPDTLGTVNSLAVAIAAQGRYDEAEPYYRRCVEGFERALGPLSRRTLTARNNLATFYRNREQFAKSEEIYRHTYDDARKGLGDDHPQTLMILDNLGGVIYAQGRTDEAVDYAVRALEGRRRVLGENHAATLRSYYNVGKLRQSQGKLDEAEANYRRALAGFRLVYGESHPNTVAARTTLSGLLLQQGHYPETEAVLLDEQRALAGMTDSAARERYPKVLKALVTFYGMWDKAEPGKGHDVQVQRWQKALDDAPRLQPTPP